MIKQDEHGFHRDEKGRFISRKQYNEHLKKVNVDLTKLTKAIPMGRIGTLLGNSLLKGLSKVFKTIRANRMLLFTAFVTPLTKALKAVKGIFGFMSKLANLTFNSIIKLFGLLWVWSKLGSLGGLNELSQAGHGGGGTGGGSQAAQRADTTFGTTHYKHLYDNIQNMANNPEMWGHFAKLGFSHEDVQRFGKQNPLLSIREFEQGIFRRAKEIGGFTSYQAPSILGSGLSGLGMDMATFRGVYERGISGEQDAYFKQQLKNTSSLEKMEREYTKLQYEFTDLWRHFAVSLGPTMMKISRVFINFGHRLAKFLGTNDNMERALDSLYKITKKVFEWLGTKGFDYIDSFFKWFDEEGLPMLKKGWQWLKDFASSASEKWKEWGGLDGIIDKVTKEYTELKEALQPVITLMKFLGKVISFTINTFLEAINATLNWGPIKAVLKENGLGDLIGHTVAFAGARLGSLMPTTNMQTRKMYNDLAVYHGDQVVKSGNTLYKDFMDGINDIVKSDNEKQREESKKVLYDTFEATHRQANRFNDRAAPMQTIPDINIYLNMDGTIISEKVEVKLNEILQNNNNQSGGGN